MGCHSDSHLPTPAPASWTTGTTTCRSSPSGWDGFLWRRRTSWSSGSSRSRRCPAVRRSLFSPTAPPAVKTTVQPSEAARRRLLAEGSRCTHKALQPESYGATGLVGEAPTKEPCFLGPEDQCAFGRRAPPPAHSTDASVTVGTHFAIVCQNPFCTQEGRKKVHEWAFLDVSHTPPHSHSLATLHISPHQRK